MEERHEDTTMLFSSLPPKPPDVGGGERTLPRSSFRDTLIGRASSLPRRERVDLIEK